VKGSIRADRAEGLARLASSRMLLGSLRGEKPPRYCRDEAARGDTRQKRDGLVSQPGDGDRFAAVEGPQARVDDWPGFAEPGVDGRLRRLGVFEGIHEACLGGPGHSAVTVTPRWRVSCHSAWLKDSTNALAAP